MDPSTLDLAVRYAAYPVAGAILANHLEELFWDASYLARGLFKRERRLVSVDALRAAPVRRIAVLVPAWNEAAVIAQMLEHNLASIDYEAGALEFFCGTYRNDAETSAEVDAVAARHPEIHRVTVPHDGPTSKADCLNWIWQGVLQEERRRGVRYDILVLHDAEDVIHPLAMRLFATLVPQHAAVQIPVFSLDRRVKDVVAGTYLDEFSEFHLKELVVRGASGGFVPSAGVGTAFARDAFERLAASNDQQPFDPRHLTEDYEIALRLRLAGEGIHFACHTVEAVVDDGSDRPPTREEYIATREYFPDAAGASVRQRARWICGINLQAWQRFGWKGSAAVRYNLWRDRKAIANGAVITGAYLLVAYLLVRTLLALWTGIPWSASAVVPPDSVLALLLQINLAGLAWRAIWKFHFVRTLHGWRHGLMALPRLVVANVVAIAATTRALRTYAWHRLSGEPLRWVKTDHVFPSAEALAAAAPLVVAEVGAPAPALAQPSPSPAEASPFAEPARAPAVFAVAAPHELLMAAVATAAPPEQIARQAAVDGAAPMPRPSAGAADRSRS